MNEAKLIKYPQLVDRQILDDHEARQAYYDQRDFKMPAGKYIYIPEDDLQRWLQILRFKDNQKLQGRGSLFHKGAGSSSKRGYCCLGVGQWAVSNSVELKNSYPSENWLYREGWMFFSDQNALTCNPFLYLDEASEVNDRLKYPFTIIADLIEKVAETY